MFNYRSPYIYFYCFAEGFATESLVHLSLVQLKHQCVRVSHISFARYCKGKLSSEKQSWHAPLSWKHFYLSQRTLTCSLFGLGLRGFRGFQRTEKQLGLSRMPTFTHCRCMTEVRAAPLLQDLRRECTRCPMLTSARHHFNRQCRLGVAIWGNVEPERQGERGCEHRVCRCVFTEKWNWSHTRTHIRTRRVSSGTISECYSKLLMLIVAAVLTALVWLGGWERESEKERLSKRERERGG